MPDSRVDSCVDSYSLPLRGGERHSSSAFWVPSVLFLNVYTYRSKRLSEARGC